MSEAMDAEFDTVAEWTADAAVRLGPDFYEPAGCRGSGGPATLDALLGRLHVEPSHRMLDVGAGVGGPGSRARRVTGVRPVLAEPQPGACRAARRLFGLPTVRADATALPFADGAFDVVWCLGVLCTIREHRRTLAEIRRVLAPGGRAGLLVYVALGPLPETPEGNDFPTSSELLADVAAAGLTVVDEREMASAHDESASWHERTAKVDAALAKRHGDDENFRRAQDQSATMGRLLSEGHVAGRVLTAVRQCRPVTHAGAAPR